MLFNYKRYLSLLLLVSSVALADSVTLNLGGGSPYFQDPVPNVGALPATGNSAGDFISVISPTSIYQWDGASWVDVTGPGVSAGLTQLNGLNPSSQTFAVGTAGADFNISSAVSTHTFNIPTASAVNRGALSSADWSTFNGKQANIVATTSADYYRGDKTFQPLNAAVIGSVLTGYVSGAGVVAATDSVLGAIQKLNGNIGALVTGVSSVFGRAGAVVSANGDYTASQVTNVPAGSIAAVTAQAALNELDSEKQALLVNSAGLAAALSDETGTGLAVFNDSPVLAGNPTAPNQAALDNSLKIANTAYVEAAVSSAATSITEKVFVSKSGSDVTGNGTILRPYASVAAALASITDAANAKRYSIEVGAGQFAETSFAMKPWIQIKGQGSNTTRFTVTGNMITLDASFNTGIGRAELRDMYLTGTTGVNWDLQTVGGVGAQAVLELHNVQMNGTLTFKGRSNDIDQINIHNAYIFNSATIDTASSNLIRDFGLSGNLTISANQASTAAYVTGLMCFGNLVTSATIGNNNIILKGSTILGTVSGNGAVTIAADPASLPALVANATMIGGAAITPIANAAYNKFEPGTPANWSVAPTIVSQALNLLAADKQNLLVNSAGLAAALSDETGTGLAVFATSPTLVTPNLGTPSALVGTNITGTAAGLSIGGNAATASALAANPSDCAAGTKAISIDAAGNLTCSAVSLTVDVSGILPVANGGTNANTALGGFNNLSPLSTKGDVLVHNGTNNIRLPVGADTFVLSANSAQASGLEWIAIPSAPVSSVFGRVGAVVSANGDYTASQVTNVAAGGIAAVTVQAAINELDSEKEPNITATTSADYYRGDKTFQPLNAAVIGSVLTGYTSGAGVVAATDSILQAIQKLNGNIAASVTGVSSVFGRSGAVVSANGDYTASQVTNVAAGNIAAVEVQAAINELDSEKQALLVNSAGLAAALSDESGTGLAVFNNSPTLITPALGTPSALVGTNITGTASALNIGGNAATATALAANPTDCAANNYAISIDASGNLTCAVVSAVQVSNTPAGNIAAVTVQAAIDELDSEKQAGPISGDATTPSTASGVITFATVNGNVGSFTNANITVNAKGLITAASNGSAGSSISSSNISGNTTGAGTGQVTYFVDTSGGAVTFTLPAAASFTSVIFIVKNITIGGANNVNVARTGADLIEGGTTDTVTPGAVMGYQSNGTNWYVLQ